MAGSKQVVEDVEGQRKAREEFGKVAPANIVFDIRSIGKIYDKADKTYGADIKVVKGGMEILTAKFTDNQFPYLKLAANQEKYV